MIIKEVGSGLMQRSSGLIVLVVASFLLIVAMIDGSPADWKGLSNFIVSGQGSVPEQEPNETVAQANRISMPGQRTGTAKYGDPAVIEFTYNNGPKDRIEDLFSFEITGSGGARVDVRLTIDDAKADLDLILFEQDRSGTLNAIGVTSGSGTSERIVPELPLPSGSYIIGVTAFDDPSNTASSSYTLQLTGESVGPAPVMTSLNPASISAGSGAFSLIVNGTNFYAGQSAVRWNGQPRLTTFINSQQLVASLTAADIANPGTATVNVVNPDNLGGASNLLTFQITPAGTQEQEVEPNETSAQATQLSVPGRRNGSVALGDAAIISLVTFTGQADALEDLFVVDLTESRRLDLRLTGSNPAADLALYLLQEKETPGQFSILGNSRLKGPAQQITTPIVLPSGRYLVGVSAVNGQSSYTIEANVSGDRRLQLSAASAAPGSKVSVPLTFTSDGTESQMTFSLSWDQSRLSNPVLVESALLAGSQVKVDTSETAQGRIGVEIRLAAGKSFVAGLVDIGQLDLQLATGTQVTSTRIDFTDRPTFRTLIDRNGRALIGSYEGAVVVAVPGFESDLTPRPYGNGDGRVTIADWAQTGRFIANVDAISEGSEFQRADSAPSTTKGDGRLTVADWVLAGRYAAGLETPVAAGGPSVPSSAATASGQAIKIYKRDPSNLSLVFTPEGVEQEARTIRVRQALFARGRENELNIELLSKGDENALGFSLVFDSSQLGFVRAVAGPDSTGALLNVNTSQVAQGRIGIGMALPTGQSFSAGTRQILKINFSVPAGGNVNATTIGFIDQPITREVVDATASILPVAYAAGEIRLDPPADLLPKLDSLEPSTLVASGMKTILTLKGSNFVDGAVGLIDGIDRPTIFSSSNELKMEVQPEDVIESGSLTVEVRNPLPGGGLSNKLLIAVVNPVPVIDSISPDTGGVGGATFTLTVNGQNFVPGSEIEFNGRRRLASWVSSTRLSAQITSIDTQTAGTVNVRVINPEPGGGVSNQVNFVIRPVNPAPRITSINPSSIELGVGSQTVVITGTNFVDGSTVLIGNDRLAATFVSATELRLVIDGSRFKSTGSVLLLVTNPAPGGGNSNWVRLSIVPPRNPQPVLTGITPSTIFAGGKTFTLTLTGSNFIASSQVRLNEEILPAALVNPVTLTAQISADLIASADTLTVSVVNPEPGGGTSAPQLLTIINPQPVLTSLTPSAVVNGGSSFTLSLTGGGFVPESKILVDGTTRSTGFVSATQLTVQIRSTDISTSRTVQVQVINPAPGGGSSALVGLSVRDPNPLPRIAAIRPSEVKVGGPGFILTVEGSRFVRDSVIRINGQPRETEFVSETLLATKVESSEIAAPKELAVSVMTPTPGGGQSSSVSLRVVNPVPRITTINPSNITAGGPDVEIVIFGEGFVSSSVVSLNDVALPSTLVTGSQLTARIPSALMATGGFAKIVVSNPAPGGGLSNGANLTVGNPVPAITRISPTSLLAGTGETNLTIEGSGFVATSVVVVNGQNRVATLIGANRLSAVIPSTDTLVAGGLSISVSNPEPGGGSSASLQLPVENPVPGLITLSPTTIVVGSAPQRLTITGQGFVPTSTVRLNSVARSTTFLSERSLAIDLLAADIAVAGTANITVYNPAPGGGISNVLALSITPPPNPVPVLERISPSSTFAGSSELLLTINGAGFTSGSVIHWAGSARSTTFVNSGQLTARISPNDLRLPGSYNVTVETAAPGGGRSNSITFQVTPSANACQTICRESADYYLQNLERLPVGTIWIERYLYNISPGSPAVRRVLSSNNTVMQKLSREFTATQLSLISFANQTGALNAKLSCYQLSFEPATLSSGTVVSSQSTLGELFNLTREVITSEQESDIQILLVIFEQLNGNNPLSRCR